MTRSVLFLHARPGRATELLRLLERLGVLAVAGEQPGFLGMEVAAAVDDPDEIVVIESWSSLDLLERWNAGREAADWRARIGDLLAEPPGERVYRLVEAVR